MKISGCVVSKRPISLSRAAKLISRFAAVESGSSPAVSLYLQQAADAFNRLVQSHANPKNLNDFEKNSENSVRESEKQTVNDGNKRNNKGKSGEASLHSKNIQTENDSETVVRESEKQIGNDGGAAEAPAKKKKKKKSGESSLDSKNIETENDSENVVRESVNEIINDGNAPAQKKKRKRGDSSLDSKRMENDSEKVVRESVNDGDSAAKKKKKKKKS